VAVREMRLQAEDENIRSVLNYKERMLKERELSKLLQID
jgi:hypothetical protein